LEGALNQPLGLTDYFQTGASLEGCMAVNFPEPAGLPDRWRGCFLAGLIALSTAGCLAHSKADFNETASYASMKAPSQTPTDEQWRQSAEAWGRRFEANPADAQAAIYYARALRATNQRAQAVAVLQQGAIRSPRNAELLAAYGKALAEAGRYKEAEEVLGRAHTPERPDWRILSAQGAVADQVGDHALAQRYYDAALKIAPGEPNVLSNLGLSYALSKRLPEAEQALRQAASHPEADGRVRQNLALVFGLQGKLQDAEAILQRDLAPEDVATALTTIRSMVAQPNNWAAIRNAEQKGGRPAVQKKLAAPDAKVELRRF
jgi:Flp pilus assembly protein TadD